MQAGATVVLVVITGFYAWQTRRLVSQEATFRKRARGEQAAYRSMEALSALALESNPSQIDIDVCRVVHDVLDESAALITDSDPLRDRLRACASAAFECLSDPRFRPGQGGPWGGTAQVNGKRALPLREIAKATRWSLQDYLAERPLRDWGDLPEPTAAQAWVVNRAKALGGSDK